LAGNDHLTKAIPFSGPELCLLALEGNSTLSILLIFGFILSVYIFVFNQGIIDCHG